MKTRLKGEVYNFLVKDHISLETHLFNDFIFQMANVKLNSDKDEEVGFELSQSWDKNEDLIFRLPQLTLPELYQLLDFFQLGLNDYKTNAPLKLNADFVFNQLLPAFKNYYEAIKLDKPAEIAKYVVKSKPILESSSIATLNQYTQKALDILLEEQSKIDSAQIANMIDGLLLLNTKVENLRKRPTLYKSVIATANQVQSFLDYPESVNNPALAKQLKLVLEGIRLFTLYNRTESVLSNKAFMKDMESYLNQEKFKISASQCDIIERTLLNLSGARLGIKGKSHMEIGYDASRMVFEFDDINKENTQKLIQFLQDNGDETAIEGSGYTRRGGPVPESAMMLKSMDFPGRPLPPREYIESHSVEMDGKFLYEKLLPLFKNAIAKLDADTLKLYREESRAYFEKKAIEESKSNKFVLFQPKTNDDDMEVSEVVDQRLSL